MAAEDGGQVDAGAGVALSIDERGVAHVTIDRPGVLNALDQRAQTALEAIWRRLENDRTVRVVVLTGTGGRAFCVGAEVSAATIEGGGEKTGVDYWAEGALTRPGGFGGLPLRTTLDVPVIARVDGYALGGGFELVLGADLIVASDRSQFGLTEPRLGRTPLEGGAVLLARRLPYHAAMGMLLTGRRVPADELYRLGLVNEIAAPDELDAAVERWVTELLACSPAAVSAIKAVVRDTARLTPAEAARARVPQLIAALTSPDQSEGVVAFREKRAPRWEDRS